MNRQERTKLKANSYLFLPYLRDQDEQEYCGRNLNPFQT